MGIWEHTISLSHLSSVKTKASVSLSCTHFFCFFNASQSFTAHTCRRVQRNVIPSCAGISYAVTQLWMLASAQTAEKGGRGFHNVPSGRSVQSCAYNTVTFSLSRHTSLFSVRSRSDHRMESRDYAPTVAGVAQGSERGVQPSNEEPSAALNREDKTVTHPCAC